MLKHKCKSNNIIKQSSLIFLALFASPLFATQKIELKTNDLNLIQQLVSTPLAANSSLKELREISQDSDLNKTLHVRTQQTYLGYRIWGAQAVIHIPKGEPVKNNLSALLIQAKTKTATVNGIIYQSFERDLQTAPRYIFTDEQKQKAVDFVLTNNQKETRNSVTPDHIKSELLVYVGKDQKAHWAYRIDLTISKPKLAEPVYIIDAISFDTYENWNNVMLYSKEMIGVGGNPKMGQLIYDNHPGHFSSLLLVNGGNCSFVGGPVDSIFNDSVVNYRGAIYEADDTGNNPGNIASANCSRDLNHSMDPKNPDIVDLNHHYNDFVYASVGTPSGGAYFPEIDAYYAMVQVMRMFKDRYQTPVAFAGPNLPISTLPVVVNAYFYGNGENAGFDPYKKMIFLGAGGSNSYPFVSLGTLGHEMAHAFTNGFSQLEYTSESGAINEAFSDMTDQALYSYFYGTQDIDGHKSWQVGAETSKTDEPRRYMDQPSANCKKAKDDCPIDNIKNYKSYTEVHLGSGIYNRAFYLLATAEGWDTLKAYDVMVQANRFYWTSNNGFNSGACGVMKAAKDFNYDQMAVINAFKDVGINVSNCM